MKPARPLWLLAAPAVFLLLWSAGFAIAKLGLPHAPPPPFVALRYARVVTLLLPRAAVLPPPLPRGWRAWADVALVGFLIQVVYFGLAYLAFKTGMSAGGVAIVVCLQPILVALIAPRLVAEAVDCRVLAGLRLGLAGGLHALLSPAGVPGPAMVRGSSKAGPMAGIALTVLALFGITAGTLYEKRFGVSHHPVISNLIQYAVGAGVTVPLALMTEDVALRWDGEFIAVMAYLVIGNSILAMSLLLAMIRAGEVSRVSSLFYLVPAMSALFAWPILGEAMPPLAWVGMAMSGAGVALVSRKKRA